MRNRKFKYLFQLVYTSVLLVIVPILLFYCLVWNRSYEEIKILNTEYYNHSLSTFMARFTDVVENFKSQVISFSVDSKSEHEELAAFYYGTPKMKEYAYYYGEAATRLRKYGQEIGYDSFGVYYYDEDVLLVDGSKYTSNRYLKDGLQIKDYDKKLFEDFYSKDRYLYNRIMCAPIRDAEGKSEKFLLGVCTVLGKEREEAILFCQIDYENVGMSYISSSGKERENYYVIDKDTEKILFSVGATQDEYLFMQQALENGMLKQDISASEGEHQKFFQRNHSTMNLAFVVDMTGDIVQNRIIGLYESVKYFFVYIIIVMLFICAIIIYFNYRPINSLLKEIKADDKYEFEAILHSWRYQEEMLSEQRMMIMDLLMNQLLYGMPISQKHVKKLGLSSEISSYYVFVIENYVLKVSETEDVISGVEDLFETLLFVTDISGKNATVLIALMKKDISEELSLWIEHWAEKHINEGYGIKKGYVVHEMNEIHRSFESCYKNVNSSEEVFNTESGNIDEKTVLNELKIRAVISNRIKEKVLDYLEEHFTDSEISQQQLADYFQISVYTLSKMFNNQIGIGFSEYLNSKRIEYAKELLSTTDIPIKKIAEMVGIPNDNYFSKTFKKFTGFSPAVFREERYK